MKLVVFHRKLFKVLILGGVLIGIFLVFRSQSLYTTCPVGFENLNAAVPVESMGSDPAFFATKTVSPEYEVPEQMATLGFDHIVGMFNVTTVFPCDRGERAVVELRALRIMRQVKDTGDMVTAREIRFDQSEKGFNEVEIRTYRRTPWFTSGVPWLRVKAAEQTNGTLELNARVVPEGIIHGWTTPRLATIPGERYVLEAEVRVTGDARLQFGMDYWRGATSLYNGWSEGCVSSNNCQAWLSDWLSDTGGEFVIWRVPAQ